MNKPITQFRNMNNEELMQYAEQIITKMRDSTEIFPEPAPELATVENALLTFRMAATEAVHRDSRAIRIRTEKRKELEYLISELAKYVDTVANKNAIVIQTSGFMLSKEAESFAGVLPKLKGLVAEPQQVGSLRMKLTAKHWKGARMYQFEYRKKGETEWLTRLSTKSKCILEGLEMFQEYEFRATYVGIHPEPNYSDIVTSYVL